MVGPVGLLRSSAISLISPLTRVAPIGSAGAPVGSLARSSLLLALTRYLTLGSHNWCWARDVLGRIVSVEFLVNRLRNGRNFRTKLLLDSVEIEAIIPVDQVDRYSQMSETARSTNAMEIGLCILREIEIDDHIHSLNVNTTSKKIRAYEVAANTVSKIVKHAVTVVLQHLGVRVEARVSKLGDFLGKQLHSICGVAENNGLIDLEFGKESVEAVNFLFLFDEAVILCYTSKSQFIH